MQKEAKLEVEPLGIGDQETDLNAVKKTGTTCRNN
jgi:hypothetical protein